MFGKINLEEANKMTENTMISHLGIRIEEIAEDHIMASMPVNWKVHQPMGYLHGGASLALAETIGSMASYLLVDRKRQNVFGQAINANHLSSKKEGMVYAKASPIHIGKTSHVWDIRVTDEVGRLISVIRMTNRVVDAR